jgi:hypothetical protein
MRYELLAATALVAVVTTTLAAERPFTATLEGHAILPAATFVAPPEDAPLSLAVSAI